MPGMIRLLAAVVCVCLAALLVGCPSQPVAHNDGAKAEATAPPATSIEKKKAKTHAAPTASLSRRRTSVIVLNGNGTPGAAATTALQLRRFHYTVAATGNANRTDFARSLVMYRKGYEGEAIRLAHDLHVKRVTPLDGMKLGELQGAHLALILGG